MGIVNVTPDSFSDGGRYLEPQVAIEHGLRLADEGAKLLDIGGESTRPGALPVALEEELRRVLPVVEGLAARGCGVGGAAEISIDTAKAAVASAAFAAGASFLNDVTALEGDPRMAELVARSGAECCLMHKRGDPRDMQIAPEYEDVVSEVKAFLEARLRFAVSEGIDERRIVLDPGIGFGKTCAHNLELLRRLDEIAALGRPVLIGTSRKSFLGRIAAEAAGASNSVPPDQRLPGTIASNVLALQRGARIFRVHEVAPVRDALALAAATLGCRWKG